MKRVTQIFVQSNVGNSCYARQVSDVDNEKYNRLITAVLCKWASRTSATIRASGERFAAYLAGASANGWRFYVRVRTCSGLSLSKLVHHQRLCLQAYFKWFTTGRCFMGERLKMSINREKVILLDPKYLSSNEKHPLVYYLGRFSVG
jgi:hypothetical protein